VFNIKKGLFSLLLSSFTMRLVQLFKKKQHMKKRALPLILSLFALSFGGAAYGQLNYGPTGATNVTGTYTDLGANGSVITTANFDDANSAPQNIGFTFNYNGSAFTQFVLNTNGFIKLGNANPSQPNLFFTSPTAPTGGVFNSGNAADANMICVFNHDLKAGTLTPEYRMFTSGTSGSHVCTIQYKNVRDSINGTAMNQYDNMQFQIKLYETSNMIEFIYGKWAATTATSIAKFSGVGLKGLDSSNAQVLVMTKASTQAWSTATFLNTNYTPTGNAFDWGNGTRPAPDSGRTYRFMPELNNDVAVTGLFTLGSLPTPFGAPRSDSAVVTNLGASNLSNYVVTLNVTGANSITRTVTIPTLPSRATVVVGFPTYSPATVGTNTVTVSVPSDNNLTNNVMTYTQIINTNMFSFADGSPSVYAMGRSGYTVVRYHSSSEIAVNSANVYIAHDSASVGKSIYAIVFDSSGVKLDSSATYTITAADTGKYHTFTLPNSPRVYGTYFYIGIGQPVTGYFPVGCQKEGDPVRTGCYFRKSFSPTSTWRDMGGLTSLTTYRPMIQATVLAATGILELTENDNLVIAYPNPSADAITYYISGTSQRDLTFFLFDVNGKMVRNIEHINSANFVMERSNLSSGTYFYKVNNKLNRMIGSGTVILK
jgi:hypothetical protein